MTFDCCAVSVARVIENQAHNREAGKTAGRTGVGSTCYPALTPHSSRSRAGLA